MAFGTPVRSGYRFPILIEVSNEIEKGILPVGFASFFKNYIGRSPTVSAPKGRVFQIRFVEEKESCMFSNGWHTFVQKCNLASNRKVFLKYFGESFFTFNREDQQDEIEVKMEPDDLSPVSDSEDFVGQITLTPYSASNNHQVQFEPEIKECLHVEGGMNWKIELYNPDYRANEARLSTGWKVFCAHLRLKAGDKISFQVVDRFKNHFVAVIERL